MPDMKSFLDRERASTTSREERHQRIMRGRNDTLKREEGPREISGRPSGRDVR
jgi:hypothetical protein